MPSSKVAQLHPLDGSDDTMESRDMIATYTSKADQLAKRLYQTNDSRGIIQAILLPSAAAHDFYST